MAAAVPRPAPRATPARSADRTDRRPHRPHNPGRCRRRPGPASSAGPAPCCPDAGAACYLRRFRRHARFAGHVPGRPRRPGALRRDAPQQAVRAILPGAAPAATRAEAAGTFRSGRAGVPGSPGCRGGRGRQGPCGGAVRVRPRSDPRRDAARSSPATPNSCTGTAASRFLGRTTFWSRVMGIVAALTVLENEATVARTDTHLWIAVGAWSVALALDTEGRFPEVGTLLERLGAIVGGELILAPADRERLLREIPRWPGQRGEDSSVTLDMTRPVVRVRTTAAGPVIEAPLSQARFRGKRLSITCDRGYLLRALRWGSRSSRSPPAINRSFAGTTIDSTCLWPRPMPLMRNAETQSRLDRRKRSHRRRSPRSRRREASRSRFLRRMLLSGHCRSDRHRSRGMWRRSPAVTHRSRRAPSAEFPIERQRFAPTTAPATVRFAGSGGASATASDENLDRPPDVEVAVCSLFPVPIFTHPRGE